MQYRRLTGGHHGVLRDVAEQEKKWVIFKTIIMHMHNKCMAKV